MKTENLEVVAKDLGYYEDLQYTVTIRRDEDGDFVAAVLELPGCMAHGPNEAVALEELRSMKRLWIETALEAGEQIPEPEDEAVLPSGKWVQRVPRRLHRDLVHMAQEEGVSLNQLVTSMLSEKVALKSCILAARSCMADALTVHISPSESNSGFWAAYNKQLPPNWECTAHVLPSGGVTQALSRVGKMALPWGGSHPVQGHQWWGEKFGGELTEDYIQEHAIRAKR